MTRAFLLFAAVSATLLLPAVAQEASEVLFDRGLRLAAEGDTSGAAASFEQALREHTSAEAHYNLGQLRLRQGDLGAARFHLESARRQAPGNGAFVQAAEAAREAAHADPVPRSIRSDVGLRALALLPASLWVGLTLVLALPAAILVRYGGTRRARYLGGVLGASAGLALIASVTALPVLSRSDAVVTASAETPTTRGPSPTSTAGPTLTPGRAVTLLERRGDRVCVRLADGTTTWIEAQNVTLLMP